MLLFFSWRQKWRCNYGNFERTFCHAGLSLIFALIVGFLQRLIGENLYKFKRFKISSSHEQSTIIFTFVSMNTSLLVSVFLISIYCPAYRMNKHTYISRHHWLKMYSITGFLPTEFRIFNMKLADFESQMVWENYSNGIREQIKMYQPPISAFDVPNSLTCVYWDIFSPSSWRSVRSVRFCETGKLVLPLFTFDLLHIARNKHRQVFVRAINEIRPKVSSLKK